MELRKKGKEAIRLGPVPLGGDSEEKGDYGSGDPPWRVSSSSHILMAPVLMSNTGKTSSLAGRRAGGPNRRAVVSPDFTCEEHVLVNMLTPKAGRRGQIENCMSGCPVSHNFPGTCPSLSQRNTLALLTSLHSSKLE